MPEFPIYDSPYFDVREWVDEKTWTELGEKAASMVDARIVRVGDRLRQLAGVPLVVNNWHYRRPGQRLYRSSGFRAVWDKTGGKLSQHRRGGAADFKSSQLTPAALRGIILANAAEFQALGLTTLEDLAYTPTWLHCDVRPLVADWAQRANPFLTVQPV